MDKQMLRSHLCLFKLLKKTFESYKAKLKPQEESTGNNFRCGELGKLSEVVSERLNIGK